MAFVANNSADFSVLLLCNMPFERQRHFFTTQGTKMNRDLLNLLARCSVVYFQVAYKPEIAVRPGSISADGRMQFAHDRYPQPLPLEKIAEVRFRANEAPVIFY